MSESYPLYDHLIKLFDDSNNNFDINRTCKTINDISRKLSPADCMDHYSEILALILHYESLRNEGVSLLQTPYNGRIQHGGKGIVFNMHKLPPKLQKIISLYVEYYSE
jgi:hypothetical protein